MNWLALCKKMIGPSTQGLPLAATEMERLLDVQIKQGDVFAVLGTVRMLCRRLSYEERVALIGRCLDNNEFAYAFYLSRPFPDDDWKKGLLAQIAKMAAFANDFSTARAAALNSEQIHI